LRVWLVAVIVLANLVHGEFCDGQPDPNAKPNFMPILSNPPTFVRSVPNGALYTAGSGDDSIPLVHLYGTPYEKGFAHGRLMKTEITTFFTQVWAYLEDQIERAINGSSLGPLFNNATLLWLAEVGLDVGLDETSASTGPWTGQWFYDEMHGMADAINSSAVTFDDLRRIHLIPELTKGQCSMFGAWGPAAANNGFITMRAFDWDTSAPFRNSAQITVYHAAPNSIENSFVNIGWTGWIAALSGVNDKQMSIHQIGVSYPDATFGAESTEGYSFTYLLRDILQFDKSQLDGISRMASAHRTCDLIMGVGGINDDGYRFNAVQYSASVCNIMDDKNLKPVADWHPPIDNVVYFGMDWLCPNYDIVLWLQLNKYYGNITAENAIRYVNAIVQTGNLHLYITDLVTQQLYTAHARRDGAQGPFYAYDRSFLQFDLPSTFAVPPPQSSN